MRSLLSNDREARTERYRRLFGCERKTMVSDSTLARVLKWLRLRESQRFESHDLLRKCLSHLGPPLRKPGAGTAGGAEEFKDAQNLFEHFGGDEEQTGWDHERQREDAGATRAAGS